MRQNNQMFLIQHNNTTQVAIYIGQIDSFVYERKKPPYEYLEIVPSNEVKVRKGTDVSDVVLSKRLKAYISSYSIPNMDPNLR